MDASYPPPVDRLLTYGPAELGEWPNYLELGLGPEHVPDLVRMAGDQTLYEDDDDGPQIWAPLHAVRALGQLRAEEAIEPLIELFHEQEEMDWIIEELPITFGMIGREAIPALTRYLTDRSRGVYSRITAAHSLGAIGKADAEAREESVAALVRQIEEILTIPEEECEEGDYTLVAYLIGDLLDLKAVEAAPVIERAFAEDRVEESITGDWEDAQVELGLLEERLTPAPRYNHLARLRPSGAGDDLFGPPPEPPQPTHRVARAKAKTKVKKKMARPSRKQNRRRKK